MIKELRNNFDLLKDELDIADELTDGRYTLLASFDHWTKMGQGIYKAILLFVDDDYYITTFSFKLDKYNLVKKCKTGYMITGSTIDYIKHYIPELRVVYR